jgi:putative endonuclease
MATVYILHSVNLNRFYIGSCIDLQKRLKDHFEKKFKGGYTSKADDWVLFLKIDDLEYK